MRKSHVLGGLLATALTGLLLATGTPASATHPVAGIRISDLDGRTFVTASTTTKAVTMQPPITSYGLQSWILSDTIQGTQVRNLSTGGCMTPDPSATAVPPTIIQVGCRGTATEYWKIISTSAGTAIFRNAGYRDDCMTIDTTSPSLATPLHLTSCQNSNLNQQFRLFA